MKEFWQRERKGLANLHVLGIPIEISIENDYLVSMDLLASVNCELKIWQPCVNLW